MFTSNFSAAVNRSLNRSLCLIPTPIRSQIQGQPILCPHPYAGNLSCADTKRTECSGALVEKATCASQCRVAKSASCWPADGPNSDNIMIPSNLTVLHVGFMCERIKILFLCIRFSLHPFPPEKRKGVAKSLNKINKSVPITGFYKCFSPHLKEICRLLCFCKNPERFTSILTLCGKCYKGK